jgi:hypothetical protein
MENATHHRIVSAATLAHLEKGATSQPYPDLLTENRPTVDTATAAHWLSRRPQTMRIWAMTGHPIRPTRVNGRLAWPVADIKRLLGVV